MKIGSSYIAMIFVMEISLLAYSPNVIAGDNRNLIIANNTNATITLMTWPFGEWNSLGRLVPNAQGSYLLEPGIHEIIFIAECVGSKELSFRESFVIHNQSKKVHQLDILPRHFNQYTMQDKPSCVAPPEWWSECENSAFGKFCGKWTFKHENNEGKGEWPGVGADLIIKRFNDTQVVIERRDPSGLKATYKGNIDGKRVTGTFTFYQSGEVNPKKYEGNWKASWEEDNAARESFIRN